jgi:hypothetical protein
MSAQYHHDSPYDEQPFMRVDHTTNTDSRDGVARPLDINKFDMSKQIAEVRKCADVIKYMDDGKP